MKPLRKAAFLGFVLACITGLIWQFGPLQPLIALTHLTDPAKLATLGKRGANARLNKIVYWLDQSRDRGMPAEMAINIAFIFNRCRPPRADLAKTALLHNLKIADGLGLLTRENCEQLGRGKPARVTRGPYAGSIVEIDHIVPYSLAPECDNELANLEMMPREMNRRKSNRVGERQLAHAQKLCAAGLLKTQSLEKIKERALEKARAAEIPR